MGDDTRRAQVEEKIIERADRKLYLDAAVIQQGRLMEANARLGKDELMTMVRFGADEIFKSKSATITDADIDALLAKGEQRTKEMQEKIKTDMQHNLQNFTLTGDEGSLYDFSGGIDDDPMGGGVSCFAVLVDVGARLCLRCCTAASIFVNS